MAESYLLVLVAGVFVLAGTVKGVIGLGLPTVSLALLVLAVPLEQAMVLLLVPSLVTNIWQALAGGEARAVWRRTWPFLLLATGMVWPGSAILLAADTGWLTGLLGALLIVYAAVSLAGAAPVLDCRRQRWLGPAAGAVNGVLAGMTGSFVVPGVLYLQAIGLTRGQLIQAMGMLFSLSTLALGLALTGRQLLPAELGLLSLAGLVPALAGMVLGQKIRDRISARAFRRVFFSSLLALGLYLAAGLVADLP